MDLETMVIDNKHIPYCVGVFDGNLQKCFYLSDFKDSDSMLIAAINSILTKEYKGFRVYLHNLSNFDGIFFLRLLKNIGEITPVFEE